MNYPIVDVDLRSFQGRGRRPWKYEQIELLEVGQGFSVPLSDLSYTSIDPAHTVRSTAVHYGRKLGRKFRTRRLDDAIQIVRVE